MDALVVCQGLGFSKATAAKGSAYIAQGSEDIWLYNVDGAGMESNLIECSYNGWGVQDCDHGEDAGAVCSSKWCYNYNTWFWNKFYCDSI